MIEINYIAVLVASVAAFAVGALWYGPLFGKNWRELMGFSAEATQSMKMTPVKAMAGGFISTLILTYVLAHFVTLIGVITVADALTLGFWIWLGFVATIMLNSVWYENRPLQLYLINASHYLVAILVAALVLSWWPW